MRLYETQHQFYCGVDRHAKRFNRERGLSAPNVEPVAWARNHGAGRVFFKSLGSPEDFQVESFLRLLENAVVWTSKRDAPKK